MAKKTEPGKMTFEQAFEELEGLVAELESGDLPLEESMENFARGQALAKRCSQLLEEAELKLISLTKDESGDYTETDLDIELDE